MAEYRKIGELLALGKAAELITVIGSDGDQSAVNRKMIISGGEVVCTELDNDLTAMIKDLSSRKKSMESAKMELTHITGEKLVLFSHYYKPAPHLIILGAGHVGAALCRIADHLDYKITLIDDRPSFANRSKHPGADLVICEKFSTALDRIEPSSSEYIVIVTRGHQHDRLCLEKALTRNAVYVGMIGSRRRVSAQMKELAALGYTDQILARVHSPIGLSIGAVTEAEISISILAEITKVRREQSRDEAFQDEVLLELERIGQDNCRAVLATIISAQGSTPRKTGSQMLIYPDGSIKGTIGGGCTEAEVRRAALDCFDQGRPGLLKLKLTAEAAADEGMACGGQMELYLELLP
jgi:xanthine dehydrogenase accessory factor